MDQDFYLTLYIYAPSLIYSSFTVFFILLLLVANKSLVMRQTPEAAGQLDFSLYLEKE